RLAAACQAAWAAAAWAAWAAWISKEIHQHAHELIMLKPASGLEWRHGFLIQPISLLISKGRPRGRPFSLPCATIAVPAAIGGRDLLYRCALWQ
ncbi:hypothetical protein, partial [Mesorhizobium sp.]|uniref:hypothetical protein n=1 Tax=Mesorhizobium sp. TaxID=1871066 RepID=UPI0025FE0063